MQIVYITFILFSDQFVLLFIVYKNISQLQHYSLIVTTFFTIIFFITDKEIGFMKDIKIFKKALQQKLYD